MKKVLYFFLAAVFAVAIAACTKPASNGTPEDNTPAAEAPTADFDYAIDGLKVTFTNKSSNATAYKWNFGDDETSKEASPEHTYAAAGTYTVKLTAANADGATASKEATLTLAGAVKAYFTFQAQTDRAGHFGLMVNFDATASENPKSISWDFGDGGEGSTDFKPVHLFPDYGKYTVKATVTGAAGDTDTYQAEVDVIAYNELLKGGSMEEDDAQYWTVVTDFAFPAGNYDTPDENTPGWLHQFGYTEDGPKGGKGGCVRFVNNQVHDQANNFKFYQAIEVEEGDYLELSAQMKWGEKTNDCGLLWFGIAESLDDIGKDGTSVVEMFNYWEPDWDNIGGNSILPLDSGFEADDAYIADSATRGIGYSNAGEPVAHYWAQKSGTAYFYVDYRSVWGTCFGPDVVILFDELSVKVVDAPEE
ncbi:MAG: PKD domain-containing protein [Bacteroidales bacterium]|nr:PKD domain-containing protein [Bacteroidales bacterium]